MNDNREEIYNKGMDEAWEIARTIIGCSDKKYFTDDMLDEIFGTHNIVRILSMNSPQQIKEKIKKYENEIIKVGEIVVCNNICNGVATYIDSNVKIKENYSVLLETGEFNTFAKRELLKTGKKMNIDEMLKQIISQ